jgi:hypothetical protein
LLGHQFVNIFFRGGGYFNHELPFNVFRTNYRPQGLT